MRNKVIVSLAVAGFFSATGYALADHEAGLPFPGSLGRTRHHGTADSEGEAAEAGTQ